MEEIMVRSLFQPIIELMTFNHLKSSMYIYTDMKYSVKNNYQSIFSFKNKKVQSQQQQKLPLLLIVIITMYTVRISRSFPKQKTLF